MVTSSFIKDEWICIGSVNIDQYNALTGGNFDETLFNVVRFLLSKFNNGLDIILEVNYNKLNNWNIETTVGIVRSEQIRYLYDESSKVLKVFIA